MSAYQHPSLTDTLCITSFQVWDKMKVILNQVQDHSQHPGAWPGPSVFCDEHRKLRPDAQWHFLYNRGAPTGSILRVWVGYSPDFRFGKNENQSSSEAQSFQRFFKPHTSHFFNKLKILRNVDTYPHTGTLSTYKGAKNLSVTCLWVSSIIDLHSCLFFLGSLSTLSIVKKVVVILSKPLSFNL